MLRACVRRPTRETQARLGSHFAASSKSAPPATDFRHPRRMSREQYRVKHLKTISMWRNFSVTHTGLSTPSSQIQSEFSSPGSCVFGFSYPPRGIQVSGNCFILRVLILPSFERRNRRGWLEGRRTPLLEGMFIVSVILGVPPLQDISTSIEGACSVLQNTHATARSSSCHSTSLVSSAAYQRLSCDIFARSCLYVLFSPFSPARTDRRSCGSRSQRPRA